MDPQKLIFKSRGWWNSQFDLYRNEEIVGSLIMTRWATCSLADIMVGKKKWEIGYEGWWNTRVFIKDENSQTIGGGKSIKGWGAHLDFAFNGKNFHIKSDNWGTSYLVTDEGGQEIARLNRKWWRPPEVTLISYNEENIFLALAAFYYARVTESQDTPAVG